MGKFVEELQLGFCIARTILRFQTKGCSCIESHGDHHVNPFPASTNAADEAAPSREVMVLQIITVRCLACGAWVSLMKEMVRVEVERSKEISSTLGPTRPRDWIVTILSGTYGKVSSLRSISLSHSGCLNLHISILYFTGFLRILVKIPNKDCIT